MFAYAVQHGIAHGRGGIAQEFPAALRVEGIDTSEQPERALLLQVLPVEQQGGVQFALRAPQLIGRFTDEAQVVLDEFVPRAGVAQSVPFTRAAKFFSPAVTSASNPEGSAASPA